MLFLHSCKEVDPDFDVDSDIKKGKFHLITYGFPIPPPNLLKASKQSDSLAKLYGFEFENRGCMIDSILQEKANTYNDKIILHLSKRNGENWFNRYNKSVDSLYKLADAQSDSIQ